MDSSDNSSPGTMNPAENWSSLTDPRERRRIQNRINQRAHRQRKREGQPSRLETPIISTHSSSSTSRQEADTTTVGRNRPTCNDLLPPQAKQMLNDFTQNADYIHIYLQGCPTADLLLTLSKINVFRAFWNIISILGLSDAWMHDDAISPFATFHPGYIDNTQLLPPSLQPTALQRTRSHHPWLDLFPLPNMRDNLLRAQDSFDEDQLCIDIMGFWDPSLESCFLFVWGEPADPRNWEVTENLLRKWPWMIRGCPELLESTNYWRRQRGEKMIFRYT